MPQREPHDSVSDADGRFGRILVVDDNLAYADAIGAILEDEPIIRVVSFTNPLKALEELKQTRFDLLILDLHMPELNGIEFLMELEKLQDGSDLLPVLIMTGDHDPGLRDTALALGTVDFIDKPFRRNEVIFRVRNLLRLRKLHRITEAHADELEQRVAARTGELKVAHIDTIHRLARAAEFRDDVTGYHIQRVGEAASLIARSMGCEMAFVDGLYHAAQLHDIGKIAVPDSILLKQGKLTTEEFDIIKRHTVDGARILADSPSPLIQLAAEVALTHHERWDGRGYPNGVAGAAIPLSGRLTSVADVYDALTHDRPYKKAWTRKEALAELDSQKGKMFDPEVVEAFFAIAPDVGE